MPKRFILASLVVALLLPAQALAQSSIAIASFGPHPVLETVIQGFRDRMTALGYAEGKDVIYTYTHANFKANLIQQTLAQVKAANPRLVLSVTTPMSQASVKAFAGSGVPIVFSAVTDPVAAGLTPSWDQGGETITGASDLQDMDRVFGFIRTLLPNAKTVGIPFHPGEANDVSIIETITGIAPKHGFAVEPVGVDKASDLPARVQSLAGKADVIYILGSNVIAPALPAIASVAHRLKIPMVDYSEGSVEKHLVLASYTVSWAGVGANSADLADKILKGATPASLAPIKPAGSAHRPYISAKRLEALGLSLPDALKNCNCVIE